MNARNLILAAALAGYAAAAKAGPDDPTATIIPATATSAGTIVGPADGAPATTTSVIYAVGTAIPFQPFDLNDFVNPQTSKPYLPTDAVTLTIGSQVKSFSNALQFLQAMNDAEKKFNALGQSLRNGSVSMAFKNIRDPAVLLGEISSTLGISSSALASKMLPALPACPTVKVEDFSVDVRVSAPFGSTSTVTFTDRKPVLLTDFVAKVNQQQQYLCALGYSYVDAALAGTQSYIDGLLAQRQTIMDSLGISPYHPIFDFSVVNVVDTATTVVNTVNAVQTDLQNPTPAHLYDLARTVTAPLPPELQLPDIPSIPAPTVPKRPDLALKKQKVWTLNQGSHDTMDAYATASLEVDGNETAEQITAQGTAGLWLLTKQINILEADAFMYAGQDGVNGRVNLNVLGQDIYTKPIDQALSYSWGDDKALDCAVGKQDGTSDGDKCPFSVPVDPEYSQPFMIGPIPAFVAVGVAGKLGIGWNAGLTVLSASGAVKPFASVNAYGIAALGIEDVLEAGVKGEITVISDNMTIQGNAAITFDDADAPNLDLRLTGDNEYTLLSGRLFAYIKADAFKAAEDLLPGAAQLVQSAGDTLQSVGGAVGGAADKVGNTIAKIGGWQQQPLYLASLGNGVGYGGFADNLESALTYYQEFDIYKSSGTSNSLRFMNYHIHITPNGTTLDGDSVDNTDRAEAAHLDDVLTLEEESIALDQLAQQAAQKEQNLFTSVDTDVNASIALQVAADPATLKPAMAALDADRVSYLGRLQAWANAPI